MIKHRRVLSPQCLKSRERQSQGRLSVSIVWRNVLIRATENRPKLLEGRASTRKGRCESALCQIQQIWLDMVLCWIFTPDHHNCDVPQNHGNVFTSWPRHRKAQTVINKTAACSGIKAASTGQCAPMTAHNWQHLSAFKGGTKSKNCHQSRHRPQTSMKYYILKVMQ